MEIIVAQCRYLVTQAEPTLNGLDDSHLAYEPQPGTKTAGWLLGHIAVTGDGGRRLCGGKSSLCPVEWRSAFGQGSNPSRNQSDYPSMATLTASVRTVYADLCELALVADPSVLAAANPYQPARPVFPTVQDFVVWMMSGHLGYHLGQLFAWRAAAGRDFNNELNKFATPLQNANPTRKP